MPFPNWIGRTRLWTRERVLASLTKAMVEIKGPLPCSDDPWYEIKGGRLDWPPASRIYFYFHSMARAWITAGAPMSRVSLFNSPWSKEEDEYLLEHAGNMTLGVIGKTLGRGYGAVKTRLNRTHHVRARVNQGFFSASELSKEFQSPYQRVRDALAKGIIKGFFDSQRNQWQVDLKELTEEALAVLAKPKRTHKNCVTDHGDYRERYGLRRTKVDGRMIVVAK